MKVQVEVDVIRPGTPSAADMQRRKLTYFAVANVLSAVICAGVLWLLLTWPEGGGFDGVMGSVWRFLRRHETVAVLAASLPFFASLLVGQFEMRKARARRARTEAVEKRARLESDRAQQELERAARRAK